LLKEQANELLNAPDPRTLKGKRDRAILALLICCGLRRAELLRLEVDHIQQREGRWVIPDLRGNHDTTLHEASLLGEAAEEVYEPLAETGARRWASRSGRQSGGAASLGGAGQYFTPRAPISVPLWM
jgi:integrase